MGEALNAIWQLAKQTVETVNQEADTVTRLSSATPFLDAFGHIVIAWLWLRQALIAQEALQKGAQADTDFYEGKVGGVPVFLPLSLATSGGEASLRRVSGSISAGSPSELVYRSVKERDSSQGHVWMLLTIRSDSV